ncbi:MAG: alpha/beta hydrolase [Acidobacteria bacterium]|nr:alpha/beta hydrolase [Acidobacteriota bacterium]
MKARTCCLLLAVSMGAHADLREGFASVPGARIFYVDSGGSGFPVVFLHAATGSVPIWQHQARAVTEAGLRFIAYDRRGYGRTRLEPGGPQPGAAVDDLAALLDHLRIDAAYLVGTAAGGGIAMDFALSYPKRTRRLVIACSLGGAIDDEHRRLGEWLRPPAFGALPEQLKELGPEYRVANRAGAERWMEIARVAHAPEPHRVVQSPRTSVTLAAVSGIRVPVLGIAGGADLYSPPSLMRRFVERIGGARLVTLPDSGHSAHWEQPEAFNRLVLEFLMERN